MTTSTETDGGEVLYARQDRLYVLKFVGAIRYTLSCSLHQFLDRLFTQQDFDAILIDLTEATCIDSTNLGLLAKIANAMWERNDAKTTIISTNPDIDETLASVGFDRIFTICNDVRNCRPTDRTVAIAAPSKTDLAQTLFEAHRLLSGLNERNRQMFRSVVEALEHEVTVKP